MATVHEEPAVSASPPAQKKKISFHDDTFVIDLDSMETESGVSNDSAGPNFKEKKLVRIETSFAS